MNRLEAEQQIYTTANVGQLVAALLESRDQTDIRRVFEHHQGGSHGFEMACQRLGIPKKDWDYANNVAGFFALVDIIGDKLGLPRHDPAAEQARRERVAEVMKAPERSVPDASKDLLQGPNRFQEGKALQGDSLEARQRSLLSESPETLYTKALAEHVRAKSEQIVRLEDKLETLIEATEASLASAGAGPGMLAGKSARDQWEAQRGRQMQRLEHLEERLERVREIREETGVCATKLEQLAEEKLRRQEPELASERDASIVDQLTKVIERSLNKEAQQLSEELGRSVDV